jgi:hypothetical protein
MKILRTITSLVGVGAVLVSFSVLLSPGLASRLPPVPSSLEAALIWGVAGFLGIYGLKAFRLNAPGKEDLYLGSERPEAVEDPDEDLSIELDAENSGIRQTVTDVLVEQRGFGEDEAERVIEDGDWTDDGVAAAYVESSVDYPVLERLREWLEDSGTQERRLKRAVNAVERLHEGEQV